MGNELRRVGKSERYARDVLLEEGGFLHMKEVMHYNKFGEPM